jgi:hypothetical protein
MVLRHQQWLLPKCPKTSLSNLIYYYNKKIYGLKQSPIISLIPKHHYIQLALEVPVHCHYLNSLILIVFCSFITHLNHLHISICYHSVIIMLSIHFELQPFTFKSFQYHLQHNLFFLKTFHSEFLLPFLIIPFLLLIKFYKSYCFLLCFEFIYVKLNPFFI